MEDEMIQELKLLYKRMIEERESIEGSIRMTAFSIGKISGIMTAIDLLDKIVEEMKEEVKKESLREMESRRKILDSLPERRAEDYERLGEEIERLSREMNAKLSALEALRESLRDALEERRRATMEKIREESRSFRE